MSKIAIKVENLSKSYLLGHNLSNKEQYTALRDVIVNYARNLLRKTKDMLKGGVVIQGEEIEEFWALKDIGFEVKKGERIGIIGRNGAGKSTLLKILSRITEPTSGRISINGRVASLLEVGTGFHPELTGRENIFLNGSILGMSRKEIQRKFDEIIQFAEIERFLDTPVKRYSSGMYVRLAFAVAAHLDPEILIVDEVLAVGDAHFQKKCLGKLEDLSSESGRTVLFVSHNLGAIKALCEKCIWIDSGNVRSFGTTSNVIAEYMEDATNDFFSNNHILSEGELLSLNKVLIKNSRGEQTKTLKPSEDFIVEIYYSAKEKVHRPVFWIDVIGQYGHLFTASMIFDGLSPASIEGDGVMRCRFKGLTMLPQTYSITIRARGPNGTDVLAPTITEACYFHVSGGAQEFFMEGELAGNFLDHDSPLLLPYEWIYEDGTAIEPSWQKNKKSLVKGN
jgi:lipopolysaccharide transport system ATP-binding protein